VGFGNLADSLSSKYAGSESLIFFSIASFGVMQYRRTQVWGDSSFRNLGIYIYERLKIYKIIRHENGCVFGF